MPSRGNTGARSMNTGRQVNRAQTGLNGRAANGQSWRRQGNESAGDYIRRTGEAFGGRVSKS